MQINFNPNVNQSRTNFKASFSEDFDTRLVLDNFNNSRYEQTNLLATHYALQDMASNDKISLVENYYDNTIYAKNLANGKEIQIKGWHAQYGSDVTANLKDAIEKGKLIDEKPGVSSTFPLKSSTKVTYLVVCLPLPKALDISFVSKFKLLSSLFINSCRTFS